MRVFGLNITIVNNDLLCCATLSSGLNSQFQPKQEQIAQEQITRYFFSQFWCEFTRKVLQDFLMEDLSLLTIQANKEVCKTP